MKCIPLRSLDTKIFTSCPLYFSICFVVEYYFRKWLLIKYPKTCHIKKSSRPPVVSFRVKPISIKNCWDSSNDGSFGFKITDIVALVFLQDKERILSIYSGQQTELMLLRSSGSSWDARMHQKLFELLLLLLDSLIKNQRFPSSKFIRTINAPIGI